MAVGGLTCSLCLGPALRQDYRTAKGEVVVIKLCPKCDRRQCSNEDCAKYIQIPTAVSCPYCGDSLAYDPSG